MSPGAGVATASSKAASSVRLEVRDLRIDLAASGADVVAEVSFAVRAGHVLGLVGESGSGKTTVALALLGHARRGLVISGGQICLDGADILRMKPSELRDTRGAKVAYVPQDPSAALNPTLRIGTQLREALSCHAGIVNDVESRMVEVIAETRLEASGGLLKRFPHQLSGGQQQRVALAMAFACRPSLIVLDEPTTGLDVSTQRHVLDTVRSLCDSYSVAAVYVSHDLAVVGGLVSEVAVMYAGRVIEFGSTNDVFQRPAHPYTRGLLAAVPSPDRAEILVGIPGQPPGPGRRPMGCSFALRCPHAIERCRLETPEPVVHDGRLVRCLRTEELVSVPIGHRRIPGGPDEHAAAALLEVAGVSASYGHSRVLDDVTLTVPSQSCTAVVGESGSGKTTLARCIVGLHSNWTGEIRFDASVLASGLKQRRVDVLKRIQYIFQNPYTSLNPRKLIGQIVSQPLERFLRLDPGERQARVVRVLEDVSLGADFLGRFPDQLSGGERQRVAIARALVVEPDLLVCDEVTSALDVSVQAVIVELLRRLQRERQLTLIFITHNLALVRSIAQSVVVLRDGRLVEAGTVEQVLEHPRDEYTVRLMKDAPKLSVVGQTTPPSFASS